eukprot:GEMP01015438.1.p1 GENE.GEMP01015438.1~~GEMP01015438.1.p1  ORF type:complete len:127 (-),score=11.50 GEMP01015438.1:1885-2265(-)
MPERSRGAHSSPGLEIGRRLAMSFHLIHKKNQQGDTQKCSLCAKKTKGVNHIGYFNASLYPRQEPGDYKYDENPTIQGRNILGTSLALSSTCGMGGIRHLIPSKREGYKYTVGVSSNKKTDEVSDM